MKYLWFLIIFLFVPIFVFAQVEITEIMYDVEGSDGGREWVEILNISNEVVDLTGWKFFEAEQNHKLKIFQGEAVLPVGDTAIIADNPAKFLLDWSGFSGTIFDSSFSLKKVGENIAIRDSEKNDIDSLTYIPQDLTDGNGASLQKIDGVWVAQTPTPGIVNTEQKANVFQENTEENIPEVKEVESPPRPVSISWPIEQQIFTRIKKMNKVVVVGAEIVFAGEALGFEKDFLNNARYSWTFGDGGTKEGDKVLHVYNYPGEYIVILNASSGKYSASDRVRIEVIPADIVISSIGIGKSREAFVEVQNNTKYELDLSGWRLRAGGKFFVIPQNTIISKKNRIIFSGEYTKFDINKGDVVELLYPNNNKVFSYLWKVDAPKVKPEIAPLPVLKTKPVVLKNKEVLDKKEKIEERREFVKTKEIKSTLDTPIVNSRQIVDITSIIGTSRNGIYTQDITKWIYSVIGLVLLAVFAFFMIKKDQRMNFPESGVLSTSESKKESDEYEIEII